MSYDEALALLEQADQANDDIVDEGYHGANSYRARRAWQVQKAALMHAQTSALLALVDELRTFRDSNPEPADRAFPHYQGFRR